MARVGYTKYRQIRPADVLDELKPGDTIGIKMIAAIGGADDYAVYYGPIEWTDEMVLRSGDKVPESVAFEMFTTLDRALAYRA